MASKQKGIVQNQIRAVHPGRAGVADHAGIRRIAPHLEIGSKKPVDRGRQSLNVIAP